MTHSLDSDCNQTSNNKNFKCNAGDACPKGDFTFKIIDVRNYSRELSKTKQF